MKVCECECFSNLVFDPSSIFDFFLPPQKNFGHYWFTFTNTIFVACFYFAYSAEHQVTFLFVCLQFIRIWCVDLFFCKVQNLRWFVCLQHLLLFFDLLLFSFQNCDSKSGSFVMFECFFCLFAFRGQRFHKFRFCFLCFLGMLLTLVSIHWISFLYLGDSFAEGCVGCVYSFFQSTFQGVLVGLTLLKLETFLINV